MSELKLLKLYQLFIKYKNNPYIVPSTNDV